MIEVSRFQVRSFDIDHLDLSWEITPTNEDLGLYSLTIQRSESPGGPWDDLATSVQDIVFFRDNQIRSFSPMRTYYYQLVFSHSVTGETKTFGPEWQRARPCLEALELAQLFQLKLQEFTGRKVWIFKRKTSGQRCGCRDVLLSRRTEDQCLSCYGVGWVGGYYSPIQVWMEIASSVDQNAVGYMSTYPPMVSKDLVIDGENRRWRVRTVATPAKRLGVVTRQNLQMYEIAKASVEYQIPLGVDPHTTTFGPEREFTLPASP